MTAGAGPLGPVTVLGAHILDVLGRPVEAIPPGQGSARLAEIRATAAGTAAGAGVDLAKLGASVLAVGAIGDDLLGDMVAAAMARHGVDTSGLSRKSGVQTSATILPIRANGERPALHVPGATSLLELADIDLDRVRRSRALLIGAPDALGDIVGDGLARVVAAARAGGALVAVDVLHPGRPRDLDRIAGLLAAADWFLPKSTSWTPPAAETASPRACWPACCSPPDRSTRRGSASPAVRWSRPAWGRTPGSKALARCWISWAMRNRPWPTGSPQRRPRPRPAR
jgi:sugar/nucleoside kinase (ribokinase family)